MLVQLVLPSAYYRALSLAVGWGCGNPYGFSEEGSTNGGCSTAILVFGLEHEFYFP